MPNIVDRFNVGGQDYHIEPVLDQAPTEGSAQGVTSGGTWQAIHDNSVVSNKKIAMALLHRHMLTAVVQGYEIVGHLPTGLATDGHIAVLSCNAQNYSQFPMPETGILQYSEDGIHWTDATLDVPLPAATDVNGVAYVGGKWIAQARSIYVSDDGKSWTCCPDTNWGNKSNTICYVHGCYYIGSSGWVARSTDGLHWNKVLTESVCDIVYYPPEDCLYLGRTIDDTTNGTLYKSTDNGLTWASAGTGTTKGITRLYVGRNSDQNLTGDAPTDYFMLVCTSSGVTIRSGTSAASLASITNVNDIVYSSYAGRYFLCSSTGQILSLNYSANNKFDTSGSANLNGALTYTSTNVGACRGKEIDGVVYIGGRLKVICGTDTANAVFLQSMCPEAYKYGYCQTVCITNDRLLILARRPASTGADQRTYVLYTDLDTLKAKGTLSL